MNPFEKYLGKEDVLLKNIGDYINLQYPSVFWCHPVNEGRRTPFERYKAKITHIRKGLPDILIFQRKYFKDKSTYAGLFIELKIKPNKPTDEQLFAMSELRKNGWNGDVCYDFDSAKLLIDSYILN
jgi:hypothetical protein